MCSADRTRCTDTVRQCSAKPPRPDRFPVRCSDSWSLPAELAAAPDQLQVLMYWQPVPAESVRKPPDTDFLQALPVPGCLYNRYSYCYFSFTLQNYMLTMQVFFTIGNYIATSLLLISFGLIFTGLHLPS